MKLTLSIWIPEGCVLSDTAGPICHNCTCASFRVLGRGLGTRHRKCTWFILLIEAHYKVRWVHVLDILSMAVDVPFESVQEIALKLARYEELFKYRYTEKDEGYRQTTQRPPRYVVSLDRHDFSFWHPEWSSQFRVETDFWVCLSWRLLVYQIPNNFPPYS